MPTPYGPARLTVSPARRPRLLLALGHGAGGGIDAPELAAVALALPAVGVSVARVEQPYRVAGRRAPAPAAHLDAAWLAAVTQWRAAAPDLPLVTGGRSSGARVAARTATALGVAGVVALAFPLRPPGRPDRSRAAELALVAAPLLVVQGGRDRFGAAADMPPGVDVHEVRGADHSFRARRVDGRTSTDCLAEVVAAVRDWLAALETRRRRAPGRPAGTDGLGQPR